MNTKLKRTLKQHDIPSYYIPPSTLREARIYSKFENRNRGKRAVQRHSAVRLKLERYQVPAAYVQLGNNVSKPATDLAGQESPCKKALYSQSYVLHYCVCLPLRNLRRATLAAISQGLSLSMIGRLLSVAGM